MKAANNILRLCETIASEGKLALQHREQDGFSWYARIEPYYDHLNTFIEYEPDLYEIILNDPRFLKVESSLHIIRSSYEQDNEMSTGQSIIWDHENGRMDGYQEIRKIINQESYWAFNHEMENGLKKKKNVMVAGSGPLPSTGLNIAIKLGINVTCVNIDPQSHAVSEQLIQLSGCKHLITSHLEDVGKMKNLEEYDAVVSTALLGVLDKNKKPEVIQHLINNLGSNTTLIVREPTGYGRLFYPCLGETICDLNNLTFSKVFPRTGPGRPYRSGLIVANKK